MHQVKVSKKTGMPIVTLVTALRTAFLTVKCEEGIKLAQIIISVYIVIIWGKVIIHLASVQVVIHIVIVSEVIVKIVVVKVVQIIVPIIPIWIVVHVVIGAKVLRFDIVIHGCFIPRACSGPTCCQ